MPSSYGAHLHTQATVAQCAYGRCGPARFAARKARMPDGGVTAAKAALRAECRARRARPRSPATAEAIAAHALATVPFPPGAAVAGYWPFADEADPRPLMRALAGRGHPLCLPALAGARRPLAFRTWAEGSALEPGAFGTSEPPAGAPERRPAVLLVPLLAADAAGFRLGYGGGYYDRTLAALDGALAVGIAFHDQLRGTVPRERHDRPLDWLVTERGARRAGDRTA